MTTPKTSTKVLAEALRVLAMDIQSEDGVANAAIAEAAGRLEELQAENKALREDSKRLDWVERLDATITSDGGYGRALTWFCGYKNEKEVVRLLRPSLREAIDSARAKSSEGGGS